MYSQMYTSLSNEIEPVSYATLFKVKVNRKQTYYYFSNKYIVSTWQSKFIDKHTFPSISVEVQSSTFSNISTRYSGVKHQLLET